MATRGKPAGGPPERSFPLVALLQTATFWALLAACVDGSRLGEAFAYARRAPDLAAGVAAAAWLAGTMIGGVVGFGQLRKWRGAAAGGLVGGVFGLTILVIAAAPAPPLRWAVGGALLLLTTIALRIRAA